MISIALTLMWVFAIVALVVLAVVLHNYLVLVFERNHYRNYEKESI